ncbi:MAG: AAA family ATPase, partial [Gammaproteobacteria bacterium]|nr:AAA family ATPase [Gammaproteobacteria bacterium]
MLRNTFLYNEYEKLLFSTLSSSNIIYIQALLLIIFEYVGNETEFKLSNQQKSIMNEETFYEYTILVAPPGCGKTALLNAVEISSHPTIQFDLKEIAADTFEKAIQLFKNQLQTEALRHNISLNIPNAEELPDFFHDLIEKICSQNGKRVIVKIDNYDTPLLASYYYHYFKLMVNWLKHLFHPHFNISRYFKLMAKSLENTFDPNFSPSPCRFILAGLAFYPYFENLKLRNLQMYYFTDFTKTPSPYFNAKEPSSVGGAWIPELIQKNKALLSDLKKNSNKFVLADIPSHNLKLENIGID